MANAAVTFSALPKQYVLARNAQVVYEPSVFAGTGSERRVNIVLDILDDPRGHLKAIEDSQVLGNALCSVIRDDGSVKAKLDLDTVRIFNAEHQRFATPTTWKGSTIHVLLEVRGHWKSRSGAGLSVLCTDIQLCTDPTPVVSPLL